MKDRSIQNDQIDLIGQRLIESSNLRGVEIDSIAEKADLFDGVLKRINADSRKPAIRESGFSFFIGKNRLALGSVLTVVFCIGIAGIYFRQAPVDRSSYKVAVPEIYSVATAKVEDSKPSAFSVRQTGGDSVVTSKRDEEPTVERAVFRQSERTKPTAQRIDYRPESQPEFYSVSPSGDAWEKSRGGRVIRVDVPRSTLFAMGVDLPLENESDTVKADLLVGPDGVTHAIRIVEYN